MQSRARLRPEAGEGGEDGAHLLQAQSFQDGAGWTVREEEMPAGLGELAEAHWQMPRLCGPHGVLLFGDEFPGLLKLNRAGSTL
ncbi:hypothetical protein BO221_30055 [Archangium sp. Cb G35]|nr:hypothetical protein BO221_30055 [Archangium sp. Cb G35]